MSTKTILGMNLLALAIGAAMALPATAQQDVMEGMSTAQQAAAASSTPPPASSSRTGMDMSSMSGMHKAPHARVTKPTRSHAGHVNPSLPAPAGSSAMQRMDMSATSAAPPAAPEPSPPLTSPQHQGLASTPGMPPSQPAVPVEMQHLHFGQMIGVRPKPGGLAGTTSGMSSMKGMDMSSMQGGNAPPDARSPDYSDGYGYGSMTGMDMNDNPTTGMVLLDRLEYAHSRDSGNAVAIDGEAWYGRNFNKLWLKFEGERSDGRLQDLRTEALWDHAVATYWDTQVGVRHDFGGGPGRTWAAFGVEGLAPYWFETQATFYVGQEGRIAARVAFEYEARLTQRLILQPDVEANFYGKNDPQRGVGSGLSDLEAGLRLRYEIRREFAPYVGLVWRQQFGRTRDYARMRGEPADDLQFVAGFRLWF